MSAISAIASGMERGFSEYGENVRRTKALEREDQRFEWEKGAEADKQRVRDAQQAYAAEMQQIQADAANGRTPGVELTDEGKAALSGGAPAPAEEPKYGLTPQGAAQQGAAPAQQSAPTPPREQQIFKSGGEGLYANQKQADDVRYKRIYDTTAKFLTSTGQVDKLFDLQKRVNDMREQGYEPMRKAAAAAVAMGDPNALRLVAKAGEVAGSPYSFDPDSGQFDSKTQTYKGVKIVGPDGKAKVQDLSAAQLLGAIGTLSAEAVVASQFARTDADRKNVIEERKADAEVTKANAYAATSRDNAATNRDTRETNATIRARQQDRSDDESAAKYFGSSFGLKDFEVKTKDEVAAMMPKEQQAYSAARKEHERRREEAGFAQNLYSLNERKVAPAQITQLMPALKKRFESGKGPDGVDAATGLPFVNFNGKKILLPKE